MATLKQMVSLNLRDTVWDTMEMLLRTTVWAQRFDVTGSSILSYLDSHESEPNHHQLQTQSPGVSKDF